MNLPELLFFNFCWFQEFSTLHQAKFTASSFFLWLNQNFSMKLTQFKSTWTECRLQLKPLSFPLFCWTAPISKVQKFSSRSRLDNSSGLVISGALISLIVERRASYGNQRLPKFRFRFWSGIHLWLWECKNYLWISIAQSRVSQGFAVDFPPSLLYTYRLLKKKMCMSSLKSLQTVKNTWIKMTSFRPCLY